MKPKYFIPAAIVCGLLAVQAAYADDVKVTIDDDPVVFADVRPTIINSRTYVPLRGVFEALGFEISWSNESKTATLIKGNAEITANTTDLTLKKDGARRTLATGGNLPVLTEGRFLLPVRSISEATGNTVNWNADTKTVEIYTSDTEKSDFKNPNGNATANEEEYIKKAYALCNEIKDIATISRNEALLRFLNRGYMGKSVAIKAGDNPRLKEIADELYNLTPASGMANIQPFFKAYADNICEFITITESYENAEITQEEALAALDELRDTKDNTAMNFSVALNDYFKEKNVFYEGVYDEYVLDMLK
ncbi:MAG: copper amine oxidase N-terminal domain-containing protein [Firmicutes bacterium]|nr:copper amine oxidase N-terminal domain-containing protein [Bacillota bacterium]